MTTMGDGFILGQIIQTEMMEQNNKNNLWSVSLLGQLFFSLSIMRRISYKLSTTVNYNASNALPNWKITYCVNVVYLQLTVVAH